MPSRRADIGPDEVQEAKAAAATSTYTSRDPLIFADNLERGLSLRVQGTAASWILKFRGRTKALGNLTEIRTASAAREVAAQARAVIRDGGNLDVYLTSRRAGGNHGKATNKVDVTTARAAGKWTWETLVKQYTDDYLSNPRVNARGIRKEPALRVPAEARRYLLMSETKPLWGRLLSELYVGDLEDIRDVCAKAGRKTASRQFVAYSKSALSFARKKHSRVAGLEGSPKWWLEVEKLDSTIPPPRERFPSVKELARTLYVAETVRKIPGRKINKETTETVLAGLWWIALTAHRVTAGLSLRKIHVLPWPDGPKGWRIAFFQPTVMKSKRPYSLPVPPRVALLFERAASPDNSAFVFPSTRDLGEKDRSLSRWSIATAIDRLRGRSSDPKAGAEFDGPDLLEGIPEFSPHDLRRTFATVCADLSIRGDAISAVLDHAESAPTGQAPIRMADITRVAYDYSQRLDLKRQAMEAWTDALFAACDDEWRRNRPFRGLNRRPPRNEPWYAMMEREKAAAPKKMDLKTLRKTSPDEEDEFAFDGLPDPD
ncbi:MAG: integrase family protein [Xanthobacteraceae bacterium]